jgi:hypothetical protein
MDGDERLDLPREAVEQAKGVGFCHRAAMI